jgi:histidine ammonia-lyase
MTDRITLTGRDLDADLVWRIAVDRVPVRLDPAALGSVDRNRAALEEAMARGDPIYGVTTGLGALVRERVSFDQASSMQRDVLRSHAAGVGDPLPAEIVRAAIAIRINGLLRAHSGVRPTVVEHAAALLNAGIVPRVPRTGSLGSSGDLAPSAHAFLLLVGEGEVLDATGAARPAGEALREAGLEPLELASKEALALVNGTHFMAAIGALLAIRCARLADCADGVAALSLEALRGEPDAFDPAVHALRPLPGQERSAAVVRSLTDRSRRLGTRERDLQDAYSFRCAPQVHGAAREGLTFVRQIVEIDLNAVTDNPLVFDRPVRVVSAGNFHGQSLALAFDTLRILLADLAAISERRTFRMLSPSLNFGLPAFLTPDAGSSSGYMVVQYTAAALLSELRALAAPVSLDTVPTSDNQEDHVSMGMTAALLSLQSAERLELVLAIEALCAAQALDLVPGQPGDGTAELHRLIRERVPPLVEDRPPSADVEAVRLLIASGELAATVARFAGE